MKGTAVMMIIISGLCFLPVCLPIHLPHIYQLVKNLMSWTEAQKYCRRVYTDLAAVHNEEDMARLSELTYGLEKVWIGLQTDTESWRWSLENQDSYGKGEAEFRMWNASEPNALGYYKVCATMFENGNWTDQECGSPYPFFCYNKNSSGFTFVNVAKTWDGAQSYCRNLYTDLASVRNQSENEQLKKMMVGSNAWIGLYRNSWKWSDGSAYSLTSWASSNPSSTVTASCGTIINGNWVNYDCGSLYYFTCYTDPAVKQRMVLKVELKKTDTSVDMEELNDGILEKFSQRLTGGGLSGEIKLRWVKLPDGSVHKKENQVEPEKEKNCGIK